MIRLFFYFFAFSIFFTHCKQTASPANNEETVVGGNCDQCDIMYEGMPHPDKISSETKLGEENEPGEKMELSGTVYNRDGHTPAKNIILYIYHTDITGHYTPSPSQTAGKRNGHLRGWVKTNDEGKFKFTSIRPAPYPGGKIPAHIHILVKEPDKTRYYIDEVWFDDDTLVTGSLRDKAEKRGGDMIIHLTKTNDNWKGNLNITLGLNIPGY